MLKFKIFITLLFSFSGAFCIYNLINEKYMINNTCDNDSFRSIIKSIIFMLITDLTLFIIFLYSLFDIRGHLYNFLAFVTFIGVLITLASGWMIMYFSDFNILNLISCISDRPTLSYYYLHYIPSVIISILLTLIFLIIIISSQFKLKLVDLENF